MGVDTSLKGIPNFDTVQIIKNSTADVVVPVGYIEGQVYSSTVIHNLGYIPGLFCYVTSPSGFASDPSETPILMTTGAGSFQIVGIADTNVSDTHVLFNVYGSNSLTDLTGTWRFHYFLLRLKGPTASAP